MRITRQFRKEVEKFWGRKPCVAELITQEIFRVFKKKNYKIDIRGDQLHMGWDVSPSVGFEKALEVGVIFDQSKTPEEFIHRLQKFNI